MNTYGHRQDPAPPTPSSAVDSEASSQGSQITVSDSSIQQALRDLRALRMASRAVATATNETDLAQAICSICVEVAGYTMAWVGRANDDADKTVAPIASFGDESGYLDTIRVTWSDDEQGRGPVGASIRTNAPALVRSTETDECFWPWRQEALKRGYHSVLSLPLRFDNGQIIGALVIYSGREDAFDQSEQELLDELAADLVLGIAGIRSQNESDMLHAMWAHARDAVLFISPDDGSIREANLAAEEFYGYDRKSLLSKTIADLRQPHVLPDLQNQLQQARHDGLLFEAVHRASDGRVLPVEVSTGAVTVSGETVLFIAIRDISARLVSERAFLEQQAQLKLITDAIADVVSFADNDGRVVWVSPSLKHVLGWNPEDWIGQHAANFVHADDLQQMRDEFGAVSKGEHVRTRHRMIGGDGLTHWVEVNARPYFDTSENLSGQVASIRLVDAEVEAEQKLERRAKYDDLTGVLSRGEVLAKADEIAQGHRRTGEGVALMFCDVDTLRQINENQGHAAGDILLQAVAMRMLSSVRQDDLVGRIGGDEFLVVLRGLQGVDNAVAVADKIRAAVAAPLSYEGVEISASISIGVAMVSDKVETHVYIDRADRGLLRAKAQGRNTVVVIDDEG